MRKSIDVEAVTASLVNAHRSKLWRNKVEDLIKSVVVASTVYKSGHQQQLKEELEFAKANIELLSEEDYKWLLEQEKPPAAESNNGVIPSFNCKLCCDGYFSASDVQGKLKDELTINSPEFKEALANSPFVCKTHDNSDTEVMDKFKKLASSFTAASNTVKDAISKSVPENTVISESQKKLWVIQMSKGKQIWYKSNNPNSRVTTSIADAELHFTKNNAKYIAGYVCASNKAIYDLPWPVKVTVKEVLCTESSSRTIELVKPVVEAIEKPITKTQVRARKPKVKEEWVLYTSGLTTPFQYYHLPSPGLWDTTTKLGNAKKFSSYSAASKVRHKLIQDGFPGFEVGESKDFEDCK